MTGAVEADGLVDPALRALAARLAPIESTREALPGVRRGGWFTTDRRRRQRSGYAASAT